MAVAAVMCWRVVHRTRQAACLRGAMLTQSCPPTADEHGHALKRRVTEGPNKGSTSPGSPQETKAAAANGDASLPPEAAAPAAASPSGKLAAAAVTTGTGGGSSENARSTLGGSHDTERLVDAMMSDAAGKVVQ